MQLKYHLGDGSANVVGGVRTTDVECPFVGAIFVCFRSEIEGDGAVGYWEAGGGVGEPAGGVGLRHGGERQRSRFWTMDLVPPIISPIDSLFWRESAGTFLAGGTEWPISFGGRVVIGVQAKSSNTKAKEDGEGVGGPTLTMDHGPWTTNDEVNGDVTGRRAWQCSKAELAKK